MNNTYGFIYRFVKRCFDILVGIIGCVLLLPLMLIVKILQIIMGDRGPLIYTQTRIGLKGKAFKIYKFRTMMTDADESLSELLNEDAYKKEWDAKQKLKEDPRITKLGRYLRKAAIDELPQLINVLKGDMSIVGPRPLVPGELERHGGLPLYNDVKPGMTGWWISNGHQDADYEKRLELEYHYVRNCSLWMDVLCLIKTAAHMIGGKADHWEKEDLPQAAESADFSVSVIIPTLNAEDYLPTLLDSLHKQSIEASEIIVIDSSSEDNTRKICEEDSRVTLLEIPREEFDHGGSRDMAAAKSSGDVIVFMTQDALPADSDFLKNLLAPLAGDGVAVSTGRQIARKEASSAEKLVREYNYPNKSYMRSKADLDRLGIKTYFVSNVCAAYRRDIYNELGGFEHGLKTNEDMFFAAKVIHNGYKIAYVADAAVYHSHDYSWQDQYERNRIQGYEIKKHESLLGDVPIAPEGKKLVGYVSRGLIKQGKFIPLVGFALDCLARHLGNRKGRRQAE